MNERRVFLLLLLPVAIAAIAIAATCEGGATPASRSTDTPTVTVLMTPSPTPLFGWQSCILAGQIAHSAEDAVSCAREWYSACPPYCMRDSDLNSVEYVETTVGQLRQVFGPPKSNLLGDPGATVDALSASDDAPVWAIVAHGTFHGWCMGCMPHEYHVGSNFWVFVLNDRYGSKDFATDERFDPSQLGDIHEVPLPLARWPTPVALETPAPTSSSP